VPVARALHAPLGLVLVRKIGAPGQPELAVAAVAALAGSTAESALPEGGSKANDSRLGPVALEVDEAILRAVGASMDHVEQAQPAALAELKRRAELYLPAHPQPVLQGRTVILVDDGVATGTTVRAAIKAIRRAGPARLVLAVPVAPAEAAQSLRPLVDEWICLRQPALFHAVGAHYRRFNQVDDDEVLAALGPEPVSAARAGRADRTDRAESAVSAA
jgi:putative phosphoribosyl transferase